MSEEEKDPLEKPDEEVLDDEKTVLRQAALRRRSEIQEHERMQVGRQIASNLSETPLDMYSRAHTICVYLSTQHEIPMRFVMDRAWHYAKTICVPAWDEEMQEYRVFSFNPHIPVVQGKFDIREPVVRFPVPEWNVDAFILPGLAFDIHGGRVGYGGGYYDRILQRATKAARLIGVCYDWQLQTAPLPQGTHDKKLDWIVSERRVVECSTGKVINITSKK